LPQTQQNRPWRQAADQGIKLEGNLDDWIDFRLRKHASPARGLDIKGHDAQRRNAVVRVHDAEVFNLSCHFVHARAPPMIQPHVSVAVVVQGAPLASAKPRVHHKLQHRVQV
jgi:hypothetical protein